MIYGSTSDNGIEANFEEGYSLPLRDLPRGLMVPPCRAGSAGNSAPAVRATSIVAGDDGDGEEWLAHPPGIALRRKTGEEELAL